MPPRAERARGRGYVPSAAVMEGHSTARPVAKAGPEQGRHTSISLLWDILRVGTAQQKASWQEGPGTRAKRSASQAHCGQSRMDGADKGVDEGTITSTE